MKPASSSTHRLAVLDALRAIAVAGVICVHFPGLFVGDYVDTGALGVRLFFVLSGFLITGLLLRDRRLIETGCIRRSRACRDFYLRRIFRIGPAYYVAIGTAWLLRMDDIRDSWPWHAAFLSNQQILLIEHWPGSLSHLWTLSLEFQFYLVWPLALFFLPRRFFPWLIFACLILGPLSRLAAPAWGAPPAFAHLVTTGSLDFFGWGAALAWCRDQNHQAAVRIEAVSNHFLAILLIAVFTLTGRWSWPAPINTVNAIVGFITGGVFATLLAVCTRSEPPAWVLWLAGRAWLVRLGMISYGIYLYHNLMHWVAPRACLRLFGDSYPSEPLLYTGVMIVALLPVSFASWYLMEAPLNRFARRVFSPAP